MWIGEPEPDTGLGQYDLYAKFQILGDTYFGPLGY